jgi:hypothetical protein
LERLHSAPKRRVYLAAQHKKRANATVAPFLKVLKGWNAKAACLGARAMSAYSTPEERDLARLEGGALLAEVKHRHAEFRAAAKGEQQHGRLDDVDAAFERLIEQLRTLTWGP